ncbi:MAG: YHS domain-containing (seleno)protein [Sumerlaeia bacterium]
MKHLFTKLIYASAFLCAVNLAFAQQNETKLASAPTSQSSSQPSSQPNVQPTSRPALIASKPLGVDSKHETPEPEKITPKDISSISNVDKKLIGIRGYDPVSYFDRKPTKGNANHSAIHQGITYRFASKANQDKFNANPDQYAPAYGGWCAYAMVDGEKVDVDPKTYKIVEGKLLLFYNGLFGNTLKKWNEKSETDQLRSAKSEWGKILLKAPQP